MAWLKLDDAFADHPKIMAAGPMAAWLHLCGMLYCARQLTDGFIPATQVRKLADLDNAGNLAQHLVKIGLWEKVDHGYQIHDFLDYNPSRADTLRRREIDRRRKAGTPLLSIEESQRNPDGIDTDSRRPVPSPSRTPNVEVSNVRNRANLDASRILDAREDDEDSTRIKTFIHDFAREMHDRAPPAASIARAVNLYQSGDLSLDEFQQAMYQARERTRAASNVRNRFAYWFTTLTDLLKDGKYAT